MGKTLRGNKSAEDIILQSIKLKSEEARQINQLDADKKKYGIVTGSDIEAQQEQGVVVDEATKQTAQQPQEPQKPQNGEPSYNVNSLVGNVQSVGSVFEREPKVETLTPTLSGLDAPKEKFPISKNPKASKKSVFETFPETRTVDLFGYGTVKVTDKMPTPYDQTDVYEGLQERVNNGTVSQKDLQVLANSTDTSPEVVNAYISKMPALAKALTYKVEDNKKQAEVLEIIKDANEKYGLEFTPEQLQTQQGTEDFMAKVQGVIQQRLAQQQKEWGKDRKPSYSQGWGDYKMYKEQDEMTPEQFDPALLQYKAFFKKQLIPTIANDDSLTFNEKARKFVALTDPMYEANLTAEAKRITRDNILSGTSVIPLSGIYNSFYDKKLEKEFDEVSTGYAKLALSQEMDKAVERKANIINAQLEQLNKDVLSGKVNKEQGEQIFNSLQKQLNDVGNLTKKYDTQAQILKDYPTILKSVVTEDINDFLALKAEAGKSNKYSIAAPKTENLSRGIFSLIGFFVDSDEKEQAAQYLASKGYDVGSQVVKDALNDWRVKDYESGFWGNENQGALGGVVGVASSTLKSVGSLLGLRDDKTLLTEIKRDQLYPREIGEFDKHQISGSLKWRRDAGNLTGQVVGQAALQYLTLGAGRALGMSEKAATTLAFWTGGAAVSYDDAYKESFELSSTDLGRRTYATLVAFFNAAAEGIFKDVKLLQVEGVNSAIRQIVTHIDNGTLTKELLQELSKDATKGFLTKAKQYGIAFGKNTSEETVEETSTSIATDITKMLYGDPNTDWGKLIDNAKETAYQTAVSMPFVAAYGAHKDIQHSKNLYQRSIYEGSIYHDQARDAIRKGYEQGLYSQDEMNQKLSILSTAVQANKELSEVQKALNIDLTEENKAKYVANSTSTAALQQTVEKLKKNNAPEGTVKSVQDKIDFLKEQKEEILKNGKSNPEWLKVGSIIKNTKGNLGRITAINADGTVEVENPKDPSQKDVWGDRDITTMNHQVTEWELPKQKEVPKTETTETPEIKTEQATPTSEQVTPEQVTPTENETPELTIDEKIDKLQTELEGIQDDNNPRIAEIDNELTELERQKTEQQKPQVATQNPDSRFAKVAEPTQATPIQQPNDFASLPIEEKLKRVREQGQPNLENNSAPLENEIPQISEPVETAPVAGAASRFAKLKPTSDGTQSVNSSEGNSPTKQEAETTPNVEDKQTSKKQQQLEIINKANPAPNDYSLWVRKVEDIKTAEEAFKNAREDGAMYDDFSIDDMQKAIETGKVTVYSSYPIENGVFVSPSRQNAQEYAGGKGGKLYSKKVSINDIAWLDEGEGQYAQVKAVEEALSKPNTNETTPTKEVNTPVSTDEAKTKEKGNKKTVQPSTKQDSGVGTEGDTTALNDKNQEGVSSNSNEDLSKIKEDAKSTEVGQPLDSDFETRMAIREKAKEALDVQPIFDALPEKTKKSLTGRKSDLFYKGKNWKKVIEGAATNADMWAKKETRRSPIGDSLLDSEEITKYYLFGADNNKTYKREIPKEYFDYFNSIKEEYNKQIDNVLKPTNKTTTIAQPKEEGVSSNSKEAPKKSSRFAKIKTTENDTQSSTEERNTTDNAKDNSNQYGNTETVKQGQNAPQADVGNKSKSGSTEATEVRQVAQILQEVENKIPNFINFIKDYAKGYLQRLSKSSEQGRRESGAINAITTIITSRIHKAIQKEQGISNANAYGKIKQVEEAALLKYAEDNDLMLDLPNTEIIGDGNESDVYLNDDDNLVTKVTFPNNYNSWLEMMDSIAIHNAQNPNTKYEIKGFTRNKDGEFSIIVEQLKVQGSPATFNKIHQDLINKGYELSGEYGNGRYIHKEEGIVIEDVKEDNVLEDKDGNLFYIDTDYYPYDKEKGDTVLFQSGDTDDSIKNVKEVVEEIMDDAAAKGEDVTLEDIIEEAKGYFDADIVTEAYNQVLKERDWDNDKELGVSITKRINNFISKLFGNKNHVSIVANSAELMKEAAKGTDVKFMKNAKGQVYGLVKEINGRPHVFLNNEFLNPNTLFHEAAGHILIDWYEKNNFSLFEAGMKKVVGSKYLQKVKNDPFYVKQANSINLATQAQTDAAREIYFKKEALAMAIGDEGARFVGESRRNDFKVWLNNLYTKVAKFFGLENKSAKQISQMTLGEFAQAAAATVLDENNDPVANALRAAIPQVKFEGKGFEAASGKFVIDNLGELSKQDVDSGRLQISGDTYTYNSEQLTEKEYIQKKQEEVKQSTVFALNNKVYFNREKLRDVSLSDVNDVKRALSISKNTRLSDLQYSDFEISKAISGKFEGNVKGMTAVEEIAVTKILNTAINAENFEVLAGNETIVQDAKLTQEAGQGRDLDINPTAVKFHLENLRAISIEQAKKLQTVLGANWHTKMIPYFETLSSVGNIAQRVGILNVISTEINDRILASTNATETAELISLQKRVDRLSLNIARELTQGMNMRRVYADFGQGKSVQDILAAEVLNTKESQRMEAIKAEMEREYTNDELNAEIVSGTVAQSKKGSSKPVQSTNQTSTEKKLNKKQQALKEKIIQRGKNALNTKDANGNIITRTIGDIADSINNLMKGFQC